MAELTPQQVLDLPMGENDAKASTICGYFVALLVEVLRDGEWFSGKQPFGNSGWEGELYVALVRAGVVDGRIDEDGYLDWCDSGAADEVLIAAAQALGCSVTVVEEQLLRWFDAGHLPEAKDCLVRAAIDAGRQEG